MDSIQTERFTIESAAGEGYELKDYLCDIDAIVSHLISERKPPVLFGYSNHGFFATHYALTYPERISALILAEPALFNQREELLNRATLAFEGDGEGSLKAMINHVQPDLGEDDNLSKMAARLILKHISDPNALGMELLTRANNPVSTEQLASLKMPVLLLGGAKSHAAYTIHRAASALPNAYVWWIQGATHGDLLGAIHQEEVSRACSAFANALGLNHDSAAAAGVS